MDTSLQATISKNSESLVGPMAGVPWEVRLEQLKAFKAQAGHLDVPGGAYEPLRSWVNTQRAKLKRGYLSGARKAALDALGFGWEARVTRHAWDANLKALQEFVAQHQQVDIAYMKRFDKTLALWANRQKGQLTRGALTEEQVAQLQALGLAPAVATERRTAKETRRLREATLQEVAAYKEAHGHLQLQPNKDPDSLYRRLMKLRHLSVNRPDEQLRQHLLKMGAFEKFPDAAWEADFADWRLYVHLTGDYACEQEAPEHVARWAAIVRRHFAPGGDALRLSIAKRYVDAKSQDYISVRNASARLAAAGFGRPTRTLTEMELVCRKISRLNGIESGQPLALRHVLRVLTARAERGTLAPAMLAEVSRMGFRLQAHRGTWQPTEASTRIAGAIVTTPHTEQMTLLVGSSRASVVQAARRHRSRPKNWAAYKDMAIGNEFRANTRQVVAVSLPPPASPASSQEMSTTAFATGGNASVRGRRFPRPVNTSVRTVIES